MIDRRAVIAGTVASLISPARKIMTTSEYYAHLWAKLGGKPSVLR